MSAISREAIRARVEALPRYRPDQAERDDPEFYDGMEADPTGEFVRRSDVLALLEPFDEKAFLEQLLGPFEEED